VEILLSYTSYPLDQTDWRGRFIYDLAHALAELPDVTLRLWGPPGPTPRPAHYVTPPQESEWFRRLLLTGGIAHLLRRRPLHGLLSALHLLRAQYRMFRQYRNVDVAHVNWLQNALALYGTQTPVLVTALGSDFNMLRWPGMVTSLRAVFRQRRTVIAPNGEWMVAPLRRHFGDVAEVCYVPLGIDERWFSIRRNLKPGERRRWLVVVRVTEKKIGPLFEWGERLFRDSDDELHLFGPKQENVSIPSWVRYHGATNPDALAQNWYPGAAGMISLSSHHEGRPQVLVEAMASGLPVLASPIPAHRDIVRHGETGWLVESADTLSEGIRTLSQPAVNVRCGEHARTWAREHIGTWTDSAQKYQRLYRTLCGPSA
jgi:glycosyltransferase involved in cell wall biosynthesis